MKRVLLILGVLVMVPGWFSEARADYTFSTPDLVDSQGNAGQGCHIAVNPAGGFVIAYTVDGGATMRLASGSGGNWNKTTVASSPDAGIRCLTWVDEGGGKHIIAYESSYQRLLYWGPLTPVQFSGHLVASSGNVGGDCSLAAGPNDDIVIFYRDVDQGHLLFTAGSGSNWSSGQVLDSFGNTGHAISAGCNDEGQKMAFYHNLSTQGFRFVGPLAPISFTSENLVSAGNVGDQCAIAAGPSDELLLLYRDTSVGSLWAIAGDGGSWDNPTSIDATGNTGLEASAGINTSGQKMAFYFDQTREALRFAGPLSALAFQVESVVTAGLAGESCSIAAGPSSDMIIGYRDGGTGRLWVVSGTTGNWQTPGELDAWGDTGHAVSAGYTAPGQKMIFYHNASTQALRYTGPLTPITFTSEVIDTANDVGQGVSAALAPGDVFCAAYEDGDDGALRFARQKDGGWQAADVHDPGLFGAQVGGAPAMFISPLGDIGIAYYDRSNADLLFASHGSPYLTGDINLDWLVNGTDLSLFGPCFGRYIAPGDDCEGSDFNLSGRVDGFDLALFGANFGRTGSDDWPYSDKSGPADSAAELFVSFAADPEDPGDILMSVRSQGLREAYGLALNLRYDPSLFTYLGSSLADRDLPPEISDPLFLAHADEGDLALGAFTARGSEPWQDELILTARFRIQGERLDGAMPEVLSAALLDHDGRTAISDGYELEDEEGLPVLPTSFGVGQNFPNPFNPRTTIDYRVPAGEDLSLVTLRVMDVSGRTVATLVNDRIEPGFHQTVWDGRDDRGRSVASGLYFYVFQGGPVQETGKMLLLR